MSRMEFIPSRSIRNPTKYVEDPYVRVDIEAKDHTNMYSTYIKDWSANVKPYIKDSWVGLIQSSKVSSVNLTNSSITISTPGYYRFIVTMNRSPNNITKSKVHGTVKFYIDNVQKGDTYDAYNSWDHNRQMDLGRYYLSKGTHTFKFNITNPALLADLKFYRVVDYSSESQHGSTRLGLSNIEFTQNSISEINTAEVSVYARDDFFRPDLNEFSRMVFDFTDSITIYVGSSNRDARAMFGGYIMGYDIDGGILTLSCGDRMIDMQRIPVFKNFSINIPAQKDEDKTWKHVSFSNVYAAVKYLITTCPYGFNNMWTDYSHAFDLNFGEVSDYDQVQVAGFSKVWDKRAGHPAPSLRLGLTYQSTVTSPNASATLYEDPTGLGYDAAIYDMLSFQYMSGGVTNQYPLQFNIKITAFKTGEAEEDAKTYTIIFTGKSTKQTNVIGTYKPSLNGKWQTFNVDLKDLLDKYKQSKNYYITKIEFVNTITTKEITNQKIGVMNIDNIQAYQSIIATKHHLDMAVDYPFDVMQTMAAESNTSIYVDYGHERRDDVIVMQPIEGETVDFILTEGFNVYEVSNISYQPRENFSNYSYRNYHYTKKVKKKDVEMTGTTTQKNTDSILRYGVWEDYDDLSDVSSKTESQKDCNRHVEQNCYGYISFTIRVKGTTLLEPDQYLTTKLDTSYLSGTHAIKSIIHTIDFTSSPTYTTQIDLGAPSNRFRQYIKEFNKRILYLSQRDNRNMYEKRAAKAIGTISPGAFVRPYYG